MKMGSTASLLRKACQSPWLSSSRKSRRNQNNVSSFSDDKEVSGGMIINPKY